MGHSTRSGPEQQINAHPEGDVREVLPALNHIDLPSGQFRYIEWDGAEPSVVLLHGLSGVAEVWQPLVNRLPSERPRLFALDQRGHGASHAAGRRYDIGVFVADTAAFIEALGLGRPHLAGHSMGARVAMALSARHPAAIRSVAMVDIGPEAWRANWVSTGESFESMPAAFDDEAAAIAFASRGREMSAEARAVFLARLKHASDGRLTWRADTEALKAIVRSHRSRNFWSEWARIQPPALLVRGGTSRELRPFVYERMKRSNPRVSAIELDGVGHNIPLIAPGALASILQEFWRNAST